MDRKGRTLLCGALRFLLLVACVSVQGAGQSPTEAPVAPAAVAPPSAAQPAAPAPAIQLADGTWTVQGTRVPGSRFCGEWLVRLTSAAGQLSGMVSHARVTVPIQNLMLMAGRELLGNDTGALVGIKTRAPIEYHWEVFGRHGQPDLRQ